MTNPFAFADATAPAPAAAPAPAPAQAAAPAPVVAPPAVAAAPAAPVAAPPVAAGGEDPFSAPAPQAARGPRVRDLYGRLLLLVPHKLEENIPNRLQPGTTQDRLTADVIVLDGGEIAFGGKPEATPPVPHTKTAAVPHKTDRMFLSQRGLISQCREALAKRMQGQPGMVLGRLTTGEAKEAGQNAPFLLTPPTDEDKAIARAYLAQVDPFA